MLCALGNDVGEAERFAVGHNRMGKVAGSEMNERWTGCGAFARSQTTNSALDTFVVTRLSRSNLRHAENMRSQRTLLAFDFTCKRYYSKYIVEYKFI